eukprot:752465-Rhodomonas_salina.3
MACVCRSPEHSGRAQSVCAVRGCAVARRAKQTRPSYPPPDPQPCRGPEEGQLAGREGVGSGPERSGRKGLVEARVVERV